jgi:hypothetical protein
MEFHLDIERSTDEASTSLWERGNSDVERLAELIQEPVALLKEGWSLTETEALG